MPKLSGINHLQAVKALEKVGFSVIRQSKHIVMSDGIRQIDLSENSQAIHSKPSPHFLEIPQSI
jgi:hypothetical protein